jgi:leucyl/phenylalanyl-tRNA--protein transferase
VTLDTAFGRVIRACASVRRAGADGTWITADMQRAYQHLFERGFAHSAEAWCGDELAGGVYGVSLGGAFFGESMFTSVSDASKAAFVALVRQLEAWRFDFVDCQTHTPHVERFGARGWPRDAFLGLLRTSLARETRRGPWCFDAPPSV